VVIYLANNTYSLETLEFIGSTTQFLTFSVNNPDGTPIDLNGATCSWKLQRYGEFGDVAVLTKTANITGLNTFQIVLDSSNTENLFGKFIQQPIVVDSGGKKFIPSQGIIIINKAIT
jgi:hypothetical protein